MLHIFLICIGGAVGTGARYLVSLWATSAFGSFPLGTLIVNAVGSFLLAFIMQLSSATELIPANVRIILGTGVMGGFTTYSTFNYETLQYLQDHRTGLAILNIALTLGGCLIAALLGTASARLIPAG